MSTTKPVNLTLAVVMLSLGAVLKKYGLDHVYVNPAQSTLPEGRVATGCHYKHADGTPGCIVGEVLVHNGVPLPNVGDPGSGTYADHFLMRLEDQGLIAIEPQARHLLASIQREQDQVRVKNNDPDKQYRCTWGEAVAAGIKALST